MPLKSEINPIPLMRKLAAAGAQLALPAIAGRGKPLIMRAYAFGDDLARGQWGIREPKPEAPEVAPDILIVPLAAFDRAGHRIGYGAGYYDMTIAALRAKKKVTAVGIAFAAQEIASGSRYPPRRAARSRANGARGVRLASRMIPKSVGTGFRTRSCANKSLERDANSLCRRCGGAQRAQRCSSGCPV